MNELLKAALVGTGKHPDVAIDESQPTDRLTIADDSLTAESKFLLRCGRRAMYERAGQEVRSVPPIEPAPDAENIAWPAAFLRTMKEIIQTDKKDFLPEVLREFQTHKLPLPAVLLPDLLNLSERKLQAAIREIVGVKGLWLSQFNPDWSWLSETAASSEEDVPNLEEIWNEGTVPQRCRALRQLREIDPVAGRQWLQDCFKKEKASDRKELLEQLATGLNSADEEFLEETLSDRSKHVKVLAGSLLARIPTSQSAQRFSERGRQLLQVSTRTKSKLKLTCHPPEKLPKDWEADGVPRKPPGQRGQRAFLTEELVTRVLLNFWQEHFQATPVELVNGILSDDFAHDVITGWSQAFIVALSPGTTISDWLDPLWKYWSAMSQHPQQIVKDQSSHFLGQLASRTDQSSLERLIITLIQSQPDPTNLPIAEILTFVPAPWSPAFGKEYLRVTRGLVSSRSDRAVSDWVGSLSIAAIALPKECFEAAFSPWKIRDHGVSSWQLANMQRQLTYFTERILFRARFHREVEEQSRESGILPKSPPRLTR